jgi:hypothetical protein
MEQKGEILIYQTQGGATKVDVRLEDETVWLSLNQISKMFQKAKSTISEHINHIYDEGELQASSTVRNFRTVQQEGKRRVNRDTEYFNLDVIISVGYRVKSHIGTHFRIWATQRLKEYIIKGFVLDDERLKQARNSYFDELLSRIRDIRTSEKVFYRKVCDIYATSMDYDANIQTTKDFFAAVQNKFHWAIHSHTAAEIITLRADAAKPNMGLTNWPGEQIKRNDVVVAKNYLQPEELDHLNRIVTQYLEFAELQALQRKPMHMKDWIEKLHGFLVLNDREILAHKGKISHEEAESYAIAEFEKYQKQLKAAESDELDKVLKTISPPKQKD